MENLKKLYDRIKGGALRDAETLPKPQEFSIGKALNRTVGLGGQKALKVKLGADLLRLTCTKAAFGKIRNRLMLFRFDTEQLEKTPGVSIQRFLNVEWKERSSQLGLVFQLGKWELGARTGSSERWIRLRDPRDEAQVMRANFLGSRWYETAGFPELGDYRITLEAVSVRDAEPGADGPFLDQMHYSLGVQTVFERDRPSPLAYRLALDTAVVCGALRADRMEAALKAAKAALPTEGGFKAEAGIVATGPAARAVVDELAALSEVRFARALAVGMLPWEGMAGRARPEQRIAIYQSVWESMLARGYWDAPDEKLLLRLLDEAEFDALRGAEQEEFGKRRSDRRAGATYRRPDFQSMAAIVKGRRGIQHDFKAVRTAMKELGLALVPDSRVGYTQFEGIHEEFTGAWSSSYSSRWLAALLVEAVREAGLVGHSAVDYGCRIRVGDEILDLAGG